ncbi:hypothetical protein DFH05DRAFT_1524882 [Lentinula detonsa]|uniref:DUF4100 domain-containing protein n=1 Tax=Lentinula detonsa TaxID=2804962 RepID=A0A9W8NZH4_9AGAR|nr:hypothetical protein DFH05DRAFT_1524882 [Lentinula detonsa]
MSIYPPTTLYNLRPPMPIPRTPSAPHFNGWYINDFLEQIVLHATQSGETDKSQMVKYIITYSSDQVKDTIRFMDQFDPNNPNVSWEAAKEALMNLYGSRDKPTEYSEDELREFCRDRSAKSTLSTIADIEKYYRDFIASATSLKKKGIITEKKFDYYFILGIPHTMKDWFLSAAPENKRTRDDPPTVAESLKILHTRFNKKSLIYEEWNRDESEKVKPVFNELGNRVIASSSSQYVNVLDEAVGQGPLSRIIPPIVPPAIPSAANANIDELTKRLEALTLAMEAMKNHAAGGNGNVLGFPQQVGVPTVKRCFICGKFSGQEGTHPLGLRNCPETNRLLADHLITFNTQTSKYTLPDGGDLPRVPPGWTGGVSSYLRHLRLTNQGTMTNREDPPHMARSTSSVELMYDNAEVLGGNGFALDSLPYESYPTTRSGRDTTQRHDPRTQVNRPDRVQQARAPRENIMIPQVQPVPTNSVREQRIPQQVRFAPEPVTIPNVQQQPASVPPKIDIQPPMNPINRNDGWKASRPGNPRGGVKDKDVEMKDGNAPKTIQPQYHFTSKVQDHADADGLLSRIGQMSVEVPLFQLLGLSPQLSKLMAENTRTKREYGVKEGTTKSAEYLDSNEDAIAAINAAFGPESSERHVYVEPNDSINEFVFRCSNAAAQIPTNRFFAMTVGDIRLSINGVEFTAMIDTGSELNVAGEHLPEAAGVPMDFDGMRWSLKGIHGDFERLRGCTVDTPMRIGGCTFVHHIFISRNSIGKHDIILGQPFLQEFSARIEYEKGRHCKLLLWENGDRSQGPSLAISITDPNHPRNATSIRMSKNQMPSASIQEVYDGEDFQE